MSFLAPLYLILGAAAAVPLLLHLLRRRIGARVEFPAARYLARAEREHSRKLRVRNILLMLLRVAIVLLVAAAAARPVGRVVGSGHAPTALAIVLDNSLSTSAVVGGRPVYARLKEAARAAAAKVTAADRVWLVTADGRVHGGSPATVRAEIERARTLAGAGDLPQAVARAASLTGGAGLPERAVAVLTDGQATSWRRTASAGESRVSIYAPPLLPPPNHAVVEADARPARWTPQGAVSARVLSPGDSATYRVTLGTRTLARGTTAADSTGAGEVVVRAAPAERGWVGGTVELEPDELRGDDVRHFAAWIGPAPSVTVDSSVGPFVSSAVDALVQSGRATTGAGVAIVAADRLARLPALIFAPSDPVRVGAANRALERAGIPWRLGPVRRGESGVRGERMAGVTTSLRHALVSPGDALADTLAAAGGEPWIVAGDRYVLVGSAMEPEVTSFPVRAAFVPWIADAVTQRLTAASGRVLAAAPGAAVPAPAWADALESTSGQPTPVRAGNLAAPDRPGVYFFERGGARAGALVVDGEPEESQLSRLTLAALAARLRGRDVEAFDDAARWTSVTFGAGSRRSLVLPFLVAALAALVLESWATGGRPRRSG